MNFSNYRLSLDIHETESGLSLRAKKGDTIRKIYVTLMDGGVPYRITSDCTAAFTARKPDNTILFNDAIIENNAIVYELTPQTTSTAGQVRCEVRLYGGDGGLITSPRFFLDVDDTVFTEGDEVVSEDEYTILEDAVARVDKAVADFMAMVENGDFTDAVSAAFIHKTGGTMTGPLRVPEIEICKNGTFLAALVTDSDSENIILRNVDAATGMCEDFHIVKPKSITESKSYDLLSTKDVVKIINGGTEATTAAEARRKLEITPGNIGAAPTDHEHAGGRLSPVAIELIPGTSNNHGGYIDFHYSGDTGDYTSRIIETAKGNVKLNDHTILTDANVIAVYSMMLDFVDGVATYTNSAIKSTSVCFVQWRAGAVSTLTDSVLSTTSFDGYVTIIAKSGKTGATLPVNILIVNL